MKDLSECKAEIRRQIVEKSQKRTALHKQVFFSVSVGMFVLACCAVFLIPTVKNDSGVSSQMPNENVVYEMSDEEFSRLSNQVILTKYLGTRYQNFTQEERDEFEWYANNSVKVVGQPIAGESQLSFKYFDDPEGYIPGESTSYGKFGDCSVWIVLGQLCVHQTIYVGGYAFPHTSSFNIWVDRNGEVTDLKDAYEKGWLTQEDVAELYLIHKAVEIKYYGFAFLYEDEETPQNTDIQMSEEKNIYGTYIRQNDEPYSGAFSIYLAEDGHFSAYESWVSSNFLYGNYTYEDGIVTLTSIGVRIYHDEGPEPGTYTTRMEEKTFTYRFRFTGDNLIYLADSSDRFSVLLPDQAEFVHGEGIISRVNSND